MTEPTWRLEDKIVTYRAQADGNNRPPAIDFSKPSVARVYDYLLGGQNNFSADRAAAEALSAKYGGAAADVCWANRQTLQRAVRYLAAEAGIRQFVDIGSGLPTQQNVHEIAHQVDPAARVVYVDKDPVVLTHGRALLEDSRTTAVIQADAADPDSILDAPDTRALIDLDRPWAALLACILHHLPDADDPVGVTRRLIERMPSGSYLFAVNMVHGGHPLADERLEADVVARLGTGFVRSWDQIRRYFEGLEWVEPGLVYADEWRPEPIDLAGAGERQWWSGVLVAGMGKKP